MHKWVGKLFLPCFLICLTLLPQDTSCKIKIQLVLKSKEHNKNAGAVSRSLNKLLYAVDGIWNSYSFSTSVCKSRKQIKSCRSWYSWKILDIPMHQRRMLQAFKLLLKLEVFWIMQRNSLFFLTCSASVIAKPKLNCSLHLFVGTDALLFGCFSVCFGFSSPNCM